MSRNEQIQPGSEIDLAIERALHAASLRAGGAQEAWTTVTHDGGECSAAEAGGISGGIDGE